ncbi:hypothetical protein DVH05_024793 [Phytophthora capsici]|nr:hypothetical protein DVH05_008437 [Phytophthora capsici]KAG1699790.1 hypothetical protein DVH05_012683 [Phytophthora capsici]KAG1708109.1 hypothetical protein DVH05_024793 [Phytophthora capsici]
MELYQIRLDTLNLAEPLLDYRSKPDSLKWIAVDDLTELAAQTRQLLRSAFDSRFFCRYTSEDYLDEGAFVFEMQQRLHPEFKNPEKSLNAVVKLLYKEQEMSDDATTVFVNSVNEAVKTRLRALMGKLVVPAGSSMVRHQQSIDADSVPISGIRARFGSRATQRPLPIQPDRVSQELRNWEIDQTEMRANESVLDFWMRMEHSSDYNILPRVVKVLFALPSSSAQIERDFSVCGEMVTSQRASLSNENVDMCAFLNRNEEFVDIAQCESIPDDELDGHIPQCVSYVMEATPRDDEDEMILDLFSQASVEEDDAAT